MNCQANQLAVVVRNTAHDSCTENMIGTPVTTRQAVGSPWGPVWFCSGFSMRCPSCGCPVLGFLDADLQPMRGVAKGETTDRGVDVQREQAVTA
jgi:hypothetical protein